MQRADVDEASLASPLVQNIELLTSDNDKLPSNNTDIDERNFMDTSQVTQHTFFSQLLMAF
jgi:hypothetical protein